VADSPIELKFTIGKDFAELSKRLRTADKTLRKELNKQIRDATKPVVADLKSAVMAIDSRVDNSGVGKTRVGGGGALARAAKAFDATKASRSVGEARAKGLAKSVEDTRAGRHGLRATIARAIQTKITTSGFRTGVRIRVDGTKLPEDQRTLPQALDAEGGWRHPVFGNREVWVDQFGKPWFASTIRKHAAAVRAKVAQAVKDTAEKLEM
jgi:hypothetical protein